MGFDTDKVQAQDTIIIAKHDVSSVKNRSRSSVLKRTPTLNNSPSRRRYKTTTTKCKCPFSISVSYHYETSLWFLVKKKRKNTILHNNHMQIDPKHLLLPKHSLSGPVLEAVNRLVQTGTSCQNIIIYIYSTFNVSLAYKTVYNIRNNYINDIIDQCSDDPAGSSVNRLINLFKNSNNVSFMYVLEKELLRRSQRFGQMTEVN